MLFNLSPTEKSLRKRVVRLVGNAHSCSGEQIQAPSGKSYILTAGHCRVLEDNGSIEVIDADNNHLNRRIIAEDPKSDLLLIEGLPSITGITVAASEEMHEHIRTFTHGAAMDTYKTDGELIQEQVVDIQAFDIQNDIDEARCKSMPKYQLADSMIDLGFMQIQGGKSCQLHLREIAGTARIRPGSSGGMVVNDSGELVGVASAGSAEDNLYVQVSDINSFLAGY